MRKLLILTIALLSSIWEIRAEDTQRQIDSLQILLQNAPQDTTRVKLLNELTACFAQMDNYDESLLYANRAKILSDSLGFKSGASLALRRIGVIHTQLGNYSKALENLLNSLQINESIINNDHELSMVNKNIGVVYYYLNNNSESLKYFIKSNEIKKNDSFTLRWIGIIYLEQKKYELSLEFLNASLKLSPSKTEIGSILNLIGTVYEEQRDNEKALDYYFKSLKIQEEINDIQGMCDAFGGIGDIYFKEKKYKEAIEYENKSLELAKSIDVLLSVQQTEEKLSQIYDSIGDKAKSYEHYKNFIAVRDSLYNEEETKKSVEAKMNFDFDKKESIATALHDEEMKRESIIRNVVIGGLILVLIFAFFVFRNYRKSIRQNKIIEEQKHLVEESKKELTDNINYAQRLQKAMLPSDEFIKNNLPENFLIYRGKDIVSGDFYWAYRDEESIYFATGDCTGHGVSGSMITMIGTALLNEIVIERKITQPDQVLNTLRDRMISSINHEGAAEERKDGMDIVFCKITGMKLECACANNPIYIVRNGASIDIKANRFPVGKYDGNTPFTLHQIDLQKDDIIYTLTDGFVDQFGGEKNKKLMSKRFKEWAVELSNMPMANIQEQLNSRFNQWIGKTEQTDDVTVFAVKV